MVMKLHTIPVFETADCTEVEGECTRLSHSTFSIGLVVEILA